MRRFLTNGNGFGVLMAVGLALFLAACSSSSKKGTVAPPDTTAEPTELEKAQTAAGGAATDAQTAADAAKAAAVAADEAQAGRAAIQTGDLMGGNSGDLAEEAETHATAASAAAATAKAESAKAEAAAGVTGAVEARIAAEAAKTLAEAKQHLAEGRRVDAVAAAMDELKIDADTRSVGGTSIMIGAKPDSRTVNGVTTKTGKQFDIIVMSKAEPGLKDGSKTRDVNGQKPAVTVAPRAIIVGEVYDSADDTARVVLVTRYIGSKTVGAFLFNDEEDGETVEQALTAESGTFYESSSSGGADGDDIILKNAGMITVLYSYGEGDDKVYLRKKSSVVDDSGKTIETRYVVVDGVVKTGISFPEATDFIHLNYGVWAPLEKADKDGGNKVAELGIGFVDKLSTGSGMTGEMPNWGGATYKGGWVANVQAPKEDGNGGITTLDGVSSVTANFEKSSVVVDLTKLARLEGRLEGSIDNNKFSGSKASIHPGEHNLSREGNTYTGSFEGAFFGSMAKEAGGVFDYKSDGNKAGAFRGAFGGVRE